MRASMAPIDTSKHIKHVGSRPKEDQDNRCREQLANLVRNIGCFHEISPEKLYLINLAKEEDSILFCNDTYGNRCPFIFWSMHDKALNYEPFNMDFGPLNLAATHHFCSKIKVWLDTRNYRNSDKCIVLVLDDKDTKRKLNITLLVAISAMVLLKLTDEEVIQRLSFFMLYRGKIGEYEKELVFREKKKFSDVSGNQSAMSLTLEDCIRAFYAALQLGFYEYYNFDHAEYLFYETVMSGDLNWIVPGKLLAFAGPSDRPNISKIYHKHPPTFYHRYFKDHNVTTIIRLNASEYDSSNFQNFGFDHHDLIFPDGYPPTSVIAARFIKIVDEAKGAVAVHCYAGIGRTGTLIAAYLMARYDFTPQMAVAWTRICRPGSVIGEQQDWLLTKFDQYAINKYHCKQTKGRKSKTISNNHPMAETEPEIDSPTTYAITEKLYGQATALLLAKKHRDNSERPCTRNSSMLKTLEDGDFTKSTKMKKTDLVLDLGKTIPLMLNFEDLHDGENPKIYHIDDGGGVYEWKVKFPHPGYVKLKLDPLKNTEIMKGHIFREPILDFRYEPEITETSSDSSGFAPQLKPIIYYSIVDWVQ